MSEVEFPHSPIPAANVASVPQRSPLRYPGGKTWLVPHIRAWLGGLDQTPELVIEPFAGGAIVSLTAVMEGLVERCLLAELDPDVAAFWKAALHHGPNLCERIRAFEPTREAVEALARTQPDGTLDRGFRALVLNRTRRGGILAPGASLSRAGESGKGVASRWYPETIVSRLELIGAHADRIDFRETDGMRLLEEFAGEPGSVVFADPPYSAGGKRAGRRLYTHFEIDHPRLFQLLADTAPEFMLTYDHAPEIAGLVRRHGFHAVQVTMKNTHHDRIGELVITRGPLFVSENLPWRAAEVEGVLRYAADFDARILARRPHRIPAPSGD
ncbi:MAG: DNA adenine methylase [Chloroflexota bacterium]|nr:DNA adenine methylase [Chloroflexota bacterium]